jgi:hypothetical protein
MKTGSRRHALDSLLDLSHVVLMTEVGAKKFEKFENSNYNVLVFRKRSFSVEIFLFYPTSKLLASCAPRCVCQLQQQRHSSQHGKSTPGGD